MGGEMRSMMYRTQPLPHRSLKHNGFTLVELLVVIGIIAVLISILLPALTKARQSAMDVQCTSNLKQIGIATAMYQNAFKGAFPLHGKAVHASWDRGLAPYLGIDAKRLDRIANPDVRLKLLECPRESVPVLPAGQYPRSYTVNLVRNYVPTMTSLPYDGVVQGMTNFDAGLAAPKMNDVRRPAECVYIFERVSKPTQLNVQWALAFGGSVGFLGVGDLVPGGQFTYGNGDYAHHGKKMSVLFVDGHASLENPREAYRNTKISWWARRPNP
jgi:prepilin-type N-terminal cleavage/methylation domain-containing protein/prepilin-type processing-associated H-X9-DG protein